MKLKIVTIIFINLVCLTTLNIFFERINETKKNVDKNMDDNNQNYFDIYDVKNISNCGIKYNNPFNKIYYDCKSYINNFELFTNLYKYNCNNENTLCIRMNISGDDVFTFINIENEIILKCGCMDKFVILNTFDEYVTMLSIINDCIIYD